MPIPEKTFQGPDGTEYTYEEWANHHFNSVFEGMPGGQTRYGAACSCGWRTSPYAVDRSGPEAQIQQHLQTLWLSAEMVYNESET